MNYTRLAQRKMTTMIVVVDSGSTKADWALVAPQGPAFFQTEGINPVHQSVEEIHALLRSVLPQHRDLSAVERVVFYGAGCFDAEKNDRISAGLVPFFPNAVIDVAHDLLGAARSACGDTPGIAAILGTGSNSCAYDGCKIVDQIDSLGYLAGDEGSGAYLGKALLRAYFYREMPGPLSKAFEAYIPGGKPQVMDELYRLPNPNLFLAHLTRFLSAHDGHPFTRQLIREAFGAFFDRHLAKYECHRRWPVHFIGSVAFHFETHLREQLQAYDMQAGRFIRRPIEALVAYHQNAKGL